MVLEAHSCGLPVVTVDDPETLPGTLSLQGKWICCKGGCGQSRRIAEPAIVRAPLMDPRQRRTRSPLAGWDYVATAVWAGHQPQELPAAADSGFSF